MKKVTLPQLYSQWDSRWGNILLGFNTQQPYNIYNYGCLITCLAMTAKYYGYSVDPASMNDKLKAVNGFASGGLYIWGSFVKVYSKLKEKKTDTPQALTDAQYNEIKSALDKGYPVMLQIDYNPKTVENDMHYVLAIGYNPADENDILVADPLGGKERSLKDYLGWFRPSMRKTIEQYVILEGAVVSTPSIKDTIIDFNDGEGNRHSVGWYVYEWFNEKTSRAKDTEVYNKEIKDQKQKVVDAEKHSTDLEGIITKKQEEIQKKAEENLTQANKIIELGDQIKQLEGQTLEHYTIGQLLLLVWEKVKDIKLKG